MVAHFGLDVVQGYMRHVQDNAEECVRRVIGVLKDGEFAYPMDNGAVIKVKVSIGADRRSATVDFTGTSPQLASNYNAPSAVVYAAVLYVFRTLVDDDIPLNAGCLKPLEIIIPEGSMLNPASARGDGRGQRRNVAVPHRRDLRRAGRDGRFLRHDEQLHLRQRSLPVLRDDFRRHGRRSRLRRHRHGPGAHDQLAPHGPRGARVALPGAHRQPRDPRGQRRQGRMARRQRRHAARALPRAHDGRDPRRAIASCRPTEWRAASPATSGATGSSAPTARARALTYADETQMGARRRLRDRDAGRRRLRQASAGN